MLPTTQLLRQIHPNHVQQSQVSSLAFEASSAAFTPTLKDADQLSVYNGEKFTPQQAFDHFVSSGFPSVGVLGVTVSEVQGIGLTATEDNHPFDGHAYVDFSSLTSKGQRKSKAKLLKQAALIRGWLHLA